MHLGIKSEFFLLLIHKKMYMNDKITGCIVSMENNQFRTRAQERKRRKTLLCDYKANSCRKKES